jgi:hypothetical protein
MNEHDRTELERLIAAARPVGPGEELDARVREALLAPPLFAPKRDEQRLSRRLSLAVAASVFVAGGIGFLCGRLSAQPTASDLVSTDAQPPAVAVEGPEERAVPASVTTMPLHDERLASLFLQPRSREGLLGAGPVRVEISQRP